MYGTSFADADSLNMAKIKTTKTKLTNKDNNSIVKCPALMNNKRPAVVLTRLGEDKENAKYIKKKKLDDKTGAEDTSLAAANRTRIPSKKKYLYEVGDYIKSRYCIVSLLGTGTFGEVYHVRDTLKRGPVTDLAIKVEKPNEMYRLLRVEKCVYDSIKGGPGIPRMFFFDKDIVTKYQLLALELLGPSLQQMLTKCGGKFTYNTVAMLADQMIERVEYIHSKNILHRDLKPENFLLGRQTASAGGKQQHKNPYYWKRVSGEEIYLVDFGLAKQYRNSIDYKHIPQKTEYTNLIGTARYASIHSHCCMELSRRDDLESIGHILVYFLKGRLPWQGQGGVNKQDKHDKIKDIKIKCTSDILCNGLPKVLAKYIDYCRRLTFEEVPDYQFLRGLFRHHINNLKLQGIPLVYDWNNPAITSNVSPKLSSSSSKAKNRKHKQQEVVAN